ncbi:MAG: YidC/Oxa1 family insertase periplasmic-domain containing protein [Fibrobacterota bacterium]|nr:MAG: YidC/Oxa1 family insertase periplasmic-domain containing protein [Fibrobacterota bacterium]
MDRKTIISLLVVTAAFLFFTSDPWHKMVRKVFHLPDPPPVATQTADSTTTSTPVDVKETVSAGSKPSLGLPSGAASDTASAKDSVTASQADSLAKAAARRIVVRTPTLEAVISGKGGRIESLRLLGVKNSAGSHPQILPATGKGALTLQVSDRDLAEAPFVVVGAVRDTIEVKGTDSVAVKMMWVEGSKGVQRTWTFRGNRASVGMEVQSAGWEKAPIRLSWNEGLLQIDEPGVKIPFGPAHFNNLVWRDNEDVASHAEEKPFLLSGNVNWVGLRSQYALAAVRFTDGFREGDLKAEQIKAVDGKEENSYRWTFQWTPETRGDKMELLVTPLEVSALKADDAGYERVLYSGYGWFFRADIWFPHLCLFVLGLLQFLYKLIPNYGVAIILLTLLARFALFPLTLKQVKQSKRMAEVMPLIKPKLDAIKEKHKDDPRKTQEETMKVYAEHGINPLAQMAGCLPLLLQMPVFISLYMVLGRAIELRGAPFTLWIHDLSRSDVVLTAVKIPFLFPEGITILPIFMALSLLGLNKMTIKDPQQQALVWMMPIMMLLFSGSMPSGLVLYWTVSNLFSMAQTWIVNPSPAKVPEVGTVAHVGKGHHKKGK